jgi:hypothetical protein
MPDFRKHNTDGRPMTMIVIGKMEAYIHQLPYLSDNKLKGAVILFGKCLNNVLESRIISFWNFPIKKLTIFLILPQLAALCQSHGVITIQYLTPEEIKIQVDRPDPS